MMKRPAIMFYTGDWMKDPHLAMCSPATRGIWIDMICLMHENSESGRLAGDLGGLSRACRCTPEQLYDALRELHQYRAAEVTVLPDDTESHQPVTILSRRMVREYEQRKYNAEKQKRHRAKQGDGDVADPLSPNASPYSVAVAVSSSVTKKKVSVSDVYNDPDFQAFWKSAYRKTSKATAAKAFLKASGCVEAGMILGAWARQNERWRAEQADKRYVPHPATWLTGERWEDEIISGKTDSRDNGQGEKPDEDLTGKHVELIGGPGAGAHGVVRNHEGGEVMFYDDTDLKHNVRQDEVRVVT